MLIIERDKLAIGYVDSEIKAIQLVERLKERAVSLCEHYDYRYRYLDNISYLLNNPVIY